MKKALLLFCLAAWPLLAQEETETTLVPRVMRVLLNEERIVPVPTNKAITTTIRFPGAIDDVHGAGFTREPQNTAGEFLIKWTKGVNYLSVAPVNENAKRNVNVVYQGRVYSFDFFPSQRDKAATTVICETESSLETKLFPTDRNRVRESRVQPKSNEGETRTVQRSTRPPSKPFLSAGSARLLGVMDTLKLLIGLDPSVRKLALEEMPNTLLTLREDVTKADTYEIRLHAVMRSNTLDALAFAVTVKNLTRERLSLNPETFLARTGTYPLRAVLSDMEPDIPPGGEVTGYFVAIGTQWGAPNYLSPDNGWVCSLENLGPRIATQNEYVPPASDLEKEDSIIPEAKPLLPRQKGTLSKVEIIEQEKAALPPPPLPGGEGMRVAILTPDDIEQEQKVEKEGRPPSKNVAYQYRIEVFENDDHLVAVLGTGEGD